MKVFISLDMEGISGIIDSDDVQFDRRNFEAGRKLLTQDLNAAIEGALDAGATKIVVNESHHLMKNVLWEDVNPNAVLIRGLKKPLLMLEGIDETFDAVFLIGYHAKAGTAGAILNHTLSDEIQRLSLNGKEVGESALSAATAAAFGVPVVLVTGDTQTAAEVQKDIPGVYTVAVKEGIGTHTASCLHPAVTSRMIREKAQEALLNRHNIKPLPKESSYTVDIEFKSPACAQMVGYMPGVELLDGRTVRYRAESMTQVMPVILAMLILAGF